MDTNSNGARSDDTRARVVCIAVVVIVGSTIAFAGPLAGTTSATSDGTSPPIAVYADDTDELTVLYENGTTEGLGITAVDVTGPTTDVDGDGSLETPYVEDTMGNLTLVEPTGNTTVLVPDDAPKSRSYLAVADWDGDGNQSIFYQNTSANDTLYRYDMGTGQSSEFLPNATEAVLGVADFDGDGTDDLVFLNGTWEVSYYDGTTVVNTGYDALLHSNGVGAGPPHDVNDDGTVRVPAVNESHEFVLVDATGDTIQFDTDYQGATETAIAVTDVIGDGTTDLLFIDNDEQLAAQDTNGTTTKLDSGDGTPYETTLDPGVAPVVTASISVDTTGLVDATNDDGYVTDGDALEVSANVTNESALDTVTANASAFGAGTVELTGSDGTYNATITVDGANASADGDHALTVTATDTDGNADTASTSAVILDTSPPKTDAGSNRTVDEGTTVTFNGSGTTDLTPITTYAWTFPDGSTSSGLEANYTFDDAGTYTVTLDATDSVGLTGADTVTITVEETSDSDDTDSGSSDGDTDDDTSDNDTEDDTSDSDTEDGDATSDSDDTDTSDGDAGTSGGGSGGQTLETDPTVLQDVNDDATDITIHHVEPGDRIPVEVRGVSTPTLVLDRFDPRMSVSGTAEFTIEASENAPENTTALSVDEMAVTAGYLDISTDLETDEFENATLEFEASTKRPDDVVLYQYDDDAWEPVGVESTGETGDGYRFRASIDEPGRYTVGLQIADLEVSALSVDERVVAPNETIVVTAAVTNTGSADGTETYRLFVDGSPAARTEIDLEAGTTRNVEFTVELSEPGTRELRVGDHTAQVDVEPPETTTTTTQVTTESTEPSAEPDRRDLGTRIFLGAVGLTGILAGVVLTRRLV